jgi:CheY-like chemotaxis protein
MKILLILACFWGFMFVLSLALVTANRRRQAVDDENFTSDFDTYPHLFPQIAEAELAHEAVAPVAEIVAIQAAPTATERRARRLAGQEKTTIFVVDDDPDILNLIQQVLDLEGFEVRSFTDPRKALEEFAAAKHRPEMVVTDYCMQPMNGMELIDRCRQTSPELKTILISGMIDEDSAAKLPNHSDRFIQKPFKVSNLIETLNDTLAEARN